MLQANNHHIATINAEAGDEPGPRQRPLDLSSGAGWELRASVDPGFTIPDGVPLRVEISNPQRQGIGIILTVRRPSPPVTGQAASRLPGPGAVGQAWAGAPPLAPGYHPAGSSWEATMGDLSRTLSVPVVADAYSPDNHAVCPSPPARPGARLDTYLDEASLHCWNRLWGRVGPVLTLRRVDWAILRRGQVPASLVRRWREHIVAKGRLSLPDLTEMASLDPHQIANLGCVLVSQDDSVIKHQNLLTFWGQTPPDRQQAMEEGKGLPIRDLPLALQPRARTLVSAALNSTAPLTLANAWMSAQQTDQAFTFSISVPDRRVEERINLSCPRWWVDLLRAQERARAADLEAGLSRAGSQG